MDNQKKNNIVYINRDYTATHRNLRERKEFYKKKDDEAIERILKKTAWFLIGLWATALLIFVLVMK